MDGKRKTRIFADCVHHTISLSGLLLKIIDTPEMQRLRRISQLSTVNLIYPSANHDRFSHSLGVCHLAGRMIDVLEYEDQKEKQKDKLCVQIAGLCHDLGHGPWSHVYDKKFLLGHFEDKWKHEEMSCQILEKIRGKLTKEFKENDIGDPELEIIKDMIKGKEKKELEGEQKKKAYLYQIVANKDYEIDVDKWDYFKRDAQACGMTETFDIERALQTVRICNTDNGTYKELCYRKGDALNMFNLFNKRFFLFKKIYYHPVVFGTEIMLAEAMAKVPSIKEAKEDVNEFLKLDDVSCLAQLKDNSEANKIIENLENRKFYKCILEKQCDKADDVKKKMEELQNEIYSDLKDNITIKKVKFNLDQLLKVPFYEKNEDDAKPLSNLNEISVMLPQTFGECFLRIYRKEAVTGCKKGKEEQFVEECKRLIEESGAGTE